MKQMFDIPEKLITEQSDEIYGVTPVNWEDSSWKRLYLVSDEDVISLSHAKVYVFSDSVLCLGKMNQNPLSNVVWEDKLTCFKSSSQYKTLDTIDGEPMEFEWKIFPGFTTLQEFLSKMSVQPEDFTGRIFLMSMFNDMSWDLKKIRKNANQALRFSPGRWSFLGLGSEKKLYSTLECTPQGEGDRVAELMMIKFGESGTPSLSIHESIVSRSAQKQR